MKLNPDRRKQIYTSESLSFYEELLPHLRVWTLEHKAIERQSDTNGQSR